MINILSLKVFTNEKQQINSKKKAKIEQASTTSLNRRSISNKAFIEIYFLNNKNDLKLFGKCEISNLIENNSEFFVFKVSNANWQSRFQLNSQSLLSNLKSGDAILVKFSIKRL